MCLQQICHAGHGGTQIYYIHTELYCRRAWPGAMTAGAQWWCSRSATISPWKGLPSTKHKALPQACLAWRNDGGRVVVVLSQRDKLAMEGDFRRLLPPAARFGTRFVFRQARALRHTGSGGSAQRALGEKSSFGFCALPCKVRQVHGLRTFNA